MFVKFNPDNGQILSITNIQPSENFINVDKEDVKLIHEGKESSNKFFVEFNETKNIYEFKKKNEINDFSKNTTQILFQIPQNTNRSGVTIVQNCNEACWKFLINDQYAVQCKTNIALDNFKLFFSVTEFNNPNILYKQLQVDLAQLIKKHYFIISFSEKFEHNKEGSLVSIYTNKIFTYNYERVGYVY